MSYGIDGWASDPWASDEDVTCDVCCGGSNCPACSHCVTLPLTWIMDLTGLTFTNGITCSNCPDYERSFSLILNQCSPCNWQDNNPTSNPCCSNCNCWELACGDFSGVKKWTITSFDSTIQYILADSLFNCNMANTFALNFNTGASCNTVPANVTIAPG